MLYYATFPEIFNHGAAAMKYIDIHTHVFPEKIAAKAVHFLEEYYHHHWTGGGDPADLLAAMDEAQVDKALIFSCATKPEQVIPANDFLRAVQSSAPGRFIAFGTLHPDFKDIPGEIKRITELGLQGIKIHPDFQNIYINEPKMFRIYEAAGKLPLMIHMGDKKGDFSSPWRLAQVLDKMPELTVIAAHLGGYSEWDLARKFLVGRNVYFDTSSSLWELPADEARQIVLDHGVDKILFGSDYPAARPAEAIADVLKLGLSESDNEKIFHLNAERLLNL
jgi:predicted TIM-barrel fold metal-dependent hydrolase